MAGLIVYSFFRDSIKSSGTGISKTEKTTKKWQKFWSERVSCAYALSEISGYDFSETDGSLKWSNVYEKLGGNNAKKKIMD